LKRSNLQTFTPYITSERELNPSKHKPIPKAAFTVRLIGFVSNIVTVANARQIVPIRRKLSHRLVPEYSVGWWAEFGPQLRSTANPLHINAAVDLALAFQHGKTLDAKCRCRAHQCASDPKPDINAKPSAHHFCFASVLLAEDWNFCHDVEIANTVQGLVAKGQGVRAGEAEAQEGQEQKAKNVSADLQIPLLV
jgi:hypothetical protein